MNNTIYSELETFVFRNCKDVNINLERIYNYRCERLFNKYIGKHDTEKFNDLEKINAAQKGKNKIFENEVILLSKRFSQENKTIIHLKRITLLNDLYCCDDAYKLRKINDIDVLIPFENIEGALDLLGSMNYYVMATGEPVSRVLLPKYLDAVIERGVHFPEFCKNLEYAGNAITIKMDCHVSLFHTDKDKERNMKKIIERHKTIMFHEAPINVLEIHDRILHLVLHFTKEVFRCDIRWYLTGERWQDRNFGIRIPLLLDIALMMDKYSEQIKPNVLFERAKELCCQDELLIVLKMVYRVFPTLYNREYDLSLLFINKDDPYFKYKYEGMFYALELGYDMIDFVLENTLSKISELLIQNARSKTFSLELGEKYYIAEIDKSDSVIGHELSKIQDRSIGCVEFALDENFFYLTIESPAISVVNTIFLTIATPKRNENLNSFINKFSISLKTIKYSYAQCNLNNGYINVNLKCNVQVDTDNDIVNIKLPKSIIGINKQTDFILCDIGLPELQAVNSNRPYVIKKYGLDDIGKRGLATLYHCSPRLLTTINLKNQTEC